MESIFKEIEDHLKQFHEFAVQHEMNEDVYTFEDSDECIGAMSELASFLFDNSAYNCEISIHLNFDEFVFKIIIKNI